MSATRCRANVANFCYSDFCFRLRLSSFERSLHSLQASSLPLVIVDEEQYGLAMIDWSSCPSVERDPEKVSGSWVFRGTRIPVIALFENLEGGASIDDFLSWFPGVAKEQVEAVLEYTIQSLKAERQAA